MAADNLEQTLACQVCYEIYEKEGDCVPRLLPCSHTFCERCLGELIGKSLTQYVLDCPECRMKHRVVYGVKSFPQKKYILANLDRKTVILAADELDEKSKCKEHGKKLIFCCKEEKCCNEICPSCLVKDHIGHNVVELEVNEETPLATKIEEIRRNVMKKKLVLKKAKEEVQMKTDFTLKKLKKKQEETTKMFEEMIRIAEERQKDTDQIVDDDIAVVDEALTLLDGISEDECTKENLDVLSNMEENVQQNLSGIRVYRFSQYTDSQLSPKSMYGDFTQAEVYVYLTAGTNRKSTQIHVEELFLNETEALQSVPASPTVEEAVPPPGPDASQLICRGSHSIQLGFSTIYNCSMALLAGNRLAVSVRENDGWRLNSYRLSPGQEGLTAGQEELCAVDLGESPDGMTEVQLGENRALALSFGRQQKIEFRDSGNLSQVLHSFSVALRMPKALHSACSGILVYEDQSAIPRKVYWPDCRSSVPVPIEGTIITQQCGISDICCARQGGKNLLVTTGGYRKLYAYATDTDALEWSLGGNLPGMDKEMEAQGVTTDGRGHLFVCDGNPGNGCVQMFSSGGRYLGYLLREGEADLGEPSLIQWNQETSSLVVAHRLNWRWIVSVVAVETVSG